MKFGKISAIAVAMTVFVASYQPAQAFVAKPAPVAPQATAGDVIEVGRRGYRRGWRRGRGYHRGYRRGYRRSRNRAIVGGLVAGALIGAVLAAPRYYDRPGYRTYYDAPRYRYRPRRVHRVRHARGHENWCYNRYRSYRAYDNTFQPYHGPRRACYSPYR